MNFTWRGEQLQEFVAGAMEKALQSGGEFGRAYWEHTAPVSTDPRTSGGLRRSWFSQISHTGKNLSLTFGSNAPYAIYVELGTSKMGPRAPVRGTAGEVVAILPSYFLNELK